MYVICIHQKIIKTNRVPWMMQQTQSGEKIDLFNALVKLMEVARENVGLVVKINLFEVLNIRVG